MYTSPTSQPRVPDCKGFEIVRKDTFGLCHELQRQLFAVLVAPLARGPDTGPERLRRWTGAVAVVRNIVARLRDKTVSPAELVVSKSLRRIYKNEGSVVQAVVNNQIARMTPGLEFPPGDRVPFLIVNGSVHLVASKAEPGGALVPVLRGKTSAMSECAVYADFVGRYDVFGQNLDWKYYLDRLRPTVVQVMLLVFPERIGEIEKLFREAGEILGRTMRTFSSVTHRDIDSFFVPGPLPAPMVASDFSIPFPAPSSQEKRPFGAISQSLLKGTTVPAKQLSKPGPVPKRRTLKAPARPISSFFAQES
jgi:hypothetical protein